VIVIFFLRGLKDSVIYPRAKQQRIFWILGGLSIYCLRTSLSLLSIDMMLTPKVHKGYSQLLVSKLCLVQMLRSYSTYNIYVCSYPYLMQILSKNNSQHRSRSNPNLTGIIQTS
jgi:hypothetical protein